MTTITLHHLDDELTARLHRRAERNGRTLEEEACCILRQALPFESTRESAAALVADIRNLVGPSGIELNLPPRTPTR